MAGHSHWAGIKHKKDRTDKIRSKIFSKLSREITVAAKLGDKDPEVNPRLRSAIQSAKSANMPKENISRAIEKSRMSNFSNYEEIRYEGFGPYNVAFILIALTDNKNRTASFIRTAFQKIGGTLGTQGSVSYNFNQLGIIRIDSKEIDEHNLFEHVIEFEADDCIVYENLYEIRCKKDKIYEVKKKLEKKIKNFISTDLEWVPINKLSLNKSQEEEVMNFFETLNENDDIQKVYTNLHNAK
tara:strand:- start:806 stop:1528 length:723 start_codon:yes stop_codon:yes gene_type:complete